MPRTGVLRKQALDWPCNTDRLTKQGLAVICGVKDLADINRDIAKLNFQYLSLIRLMAREDKMLAQQRFGIHGLTVDRIARMSMDDIEQLANSSNMMFQVRSNAALDIMIHHMTNPDVSATQVENLRMASMLCDTASPGRYQNAV